MKKKWIRKRPYKKRTRKGVRKVRAHKQRYSFSGFYQRPWEVSHLLEKTRQEFSEAGIDHLKGLKKWDLQQKTYEDFGVPHEETQSMVKEDLINYYRDLYIEELGKSRR